MPILENDAMKLLRAVTGKDDKALDEIVISGIDISGYQKEVEWASVKATQSFVYIKATEGQDHRSKLFEEQSQACIDHEIPFGYYHFATPRLVDPVLEAKDFISALKVYKAHWTLPPVLDLEQNKESMSKREMENWCLSFIHTVEEEFDRKLMLYGSPGLLNSYLAEGHGIEKKVLLWIANYTSAATPRLPVGFKSWDVWQFTDKGKVEGIEGGVDVNRARLRFLYENMHKNA